MKSHIINKGIYSSIFLFVLTSSASAGHPRMIKSTVVTPPHARVMKGCVVPPVIIAPGKFYVGAFGGWGTSRSFDVNQYGTAFYPEALGGPLAVNAQGSTNSPSAWLLGLQVGYQMPEVLVDPCLKWNLAPAIELEGYYLRNSSYNGHIINEEATRLDEHDFDVSYPVRRGVFLTNFVVGLNIPCYDFHPYVGVGIGGAIMRISGADSTQISPPEPGINHYNSNNTDTASTFAGQVKVGVSYDINKCVNVFAEYRWLYLSSTHFSFGSTVYPGHFVTSNWQVKLDPHNFNMGAVGIRYTF